MGRVPDFSGDRLDSWKAIAAYLNRGVRTVRRWEREEGMPVHRHVHNVLGSVYAYKAEIDTWRQNARGEVAAKRPPARRRSLAGDESARSIAVLPFANLSADPENEFFADGLTDEVTADLSRIDAVRVISRTSAMTFKRTSKDVQAIARELGVRYVLEGSVRRAGERLRITAQLIDAASDEQLWGDKFDGSVEDVFSIQERIARLIVQALALRLTASEERSLAARPIANVHAYECYLQARQEAWRWRRDAIDHAVQLLHNGLTIIGPNAKLYAALGHAHLQYREAGIDFSERPLDAAEDCVRQVVALEPTSASALQLRGWIHYGRGRIQQAVRDLRAALAAEPNNPDTLLLLTNCYLISGKVASARPLIQRVLVVDPLTPLSRCLPAFADVMEGKLASAVGPYQEMFEMDPANPMGRLFYVYALVLSGSTGSLDAVLEAFPVEVRDTIPAKIAFFLAHAATGAVANAQAELSNEIEAITAGTDLFPRMLAEGYALAGLTERALHWLAIAVDRGFINYPFLAHYDPSFGSLRGDARFENLMRTVRARWEEFVP